MEKKKPILKAKPKDPKVEKLKENILYHLKASEQAKEKHMSLYHLDQSRLYQWQLILDHGLALRGKDKFGPATDSDRAYAENYRKMRERDRKKREKSMKEVAERAKEAPPPPPPAVEKKKPILKKKIEEAPPAESKKEVKEKLKIVLKKALKKEEKAVVQEAAKVLTSAEIRQKILEAAGGASAIAKEKEQQAAKAEPKKEKEKRERRGAIKAGESQFAARFEMGVDTLTDLALTLPKEIPKRTVKSGYDERIKRLKQEINKKKGTIEEGSTKTGRQHKETYKPKELRDLAKLIREKYDLSLGWNLVSPEIAKKIYEDWYKNREVVFTENSRSEVSAEVAEKRVAPRVDVRVPSVITKTKVPDVIAPGTRYERIEYYTRRDYDGIDKLKETVYEIDVTPVYFWFYSLSQDLATTLQREDDDKVRQQFKKDYPQLFEK